MAVELSIDHMVVSAERLEDGVAHVRDLLGVEMGPGGKHAAMGTHNRLARFGARYLEVIAIDPDAPPPARPRWFDLDNFSGPPRLTNWVVRVSDMDAALALAPEGIGRPMALSRDDLHWIVAVSDDGTLPFDGMFPGFIDWGDSPHPVTRMPDSGCRFSVVKMAHPRAEVLGAAFAPYTCGPCWKQVQAPAPALSTTVLTPRGPRELR